MGMSVGGSRRKGRVQPEMNVTPLVDVVLVLLIIFMILAPIITEAFVVRLPPKDDDKQAELEEATEALLMEALRELDKAIRAMPPDQQKRFAGYRDLAKLSPAQRMAKLRQLAAQGGVPGLPGAGAAPTPTPPPTPPAAAGGWITRHDLDAPPGYDPAHVDVGKFVTWAIAQAKQAIPDAELIRIDTNGVSADGVANLSYPTLASDHGSIDVRFISPSRGKRDPSQPLGVGRKDFKCMFRVEAEPDGVTIAPIDFFDCAKEHAVPLPRCSFSAVWKKAIKKKAPTGNVVGNVDYRFGGGRPTWYFSIGFGTDVTYSKLFGDDC